ncbi:type II toxin-antitoxin system VapC family toxin [Candidatus Sumerlaeota bacterium]|nr:type II toxin-antitoxin system VapC family toxin [Candidatus Sumerlaeota bacterium]
MFLVDTSVWIDHFRRRLPPLVDLLVSGQVATHPFVIGELACENLANREEILRLLAALPSVTAASHEEALELVERHALAGSGIGWIDAHLLASALVGGVSLWTDDTDLKTVAARLGVAALA